MSHPWPPERVDCFARLWRAGLSYEHIGLALDIGPGTVRQAVSRLRRRGVDLPRRHAGRPAWTPERVAKAAAALRAGADGAGLAAVMGVSASSVRATLYRLRAEGHDLRGPP